MTLLFYLRVESDVEGWYGKMFLSLCPEQQAAWHGGKIFLATSKTLVPIWSLLLSALVTGATLSFCSLL